jgi:hypothetical protein
MALAEPCEYCEELQRFTGDKKMICFKCQQKRVWDKDPHTRLY